MIIRYRTNERGDSKSKSIDERLSALETAEAVRGLLNKYGEAVDAQDLDGLSALLADDVHLSIGEVELSGKEAVVGFFEAAFRDDPAPKSHFIANVETKWLGPAGLVAAHSSFFWTAREPESSVIGWGSYRHHARATAGGAHFTDIEIKIDHVGGLEEGWAMGPRGEA